MFKSNELIRLYLINCYLYYELDVNVLSDYEFDQLCKQLLAELPNLEHMHKHLVSEEALKASTGYDIKYPEIVKDSAIRYYNNFLKQKGLI